MNDLSDVTKARLHRIADLMLELYQLLARMRYIHSERLCEGPRDLNHYETLFDELGLDPAIRYLYSILPLAGGSWACKKRFANNGNERAIRSSRQRGMALQPWMMPLCVPGLDWAVLVYSARDHVIWVQDLQQTTCTAEEEPSDPFGYLPPGPDGCTGAKESNEEPEKASWQLADAHPAEDVLQEFMRRYSDLSEIPGDDEIHYLCFWRPLVVRPLLRKHGWPSRDFDGDAFQVDLNIANATKHGHQFPVFHTLERYFKLRNPMHDPEMLATRRDQDRRLDELGARSTDIDERWSARWQLWDQSREERDLWTELESRINRECLDGLCQWSAVLPLFVADHLSSEITFADCGVRACEEQVQDTIANGLEVEEADAVKLVLRQKEVALLRKALDLVSADAARLCPGQSWQGISFRQPSERRKLWPYLWRDKEAVQNNRAYLKELYEWLERVPDEASTTKAKIAEKAKVHEKRLDTSISVLSELEGRWEELGPISDDEEFAQHLFQHCNKCQEYIRREEEEWRVGINFRKKVPLT